MKGAGFTLVEVLVALVVVEVGLLGVLGTMVLAARLMNEAQVLEYGVAAMEEAYQEARLGRLSGSGRRQLATGGEVRWSVSGDGSVRIWLSSGNEAPEAVVEGAVLP